MRHLVAIAFALFAAAAGAQPAAGHYYSLIDDGMYGYEAGVSQVERTQGQTAGPVAMVGFNGTKNGVLQLMRLEHPSTVYVFQCSLPCEFYKTMLFEGGKFAATDMARNAKGSLIWMAFEDAAAGRLQRYVDRRKPSQPMHVWCTQAAGCNATRAPK